ncbi:MAG: regulatory protein RecX [Massilia sp.]
MYLINSKTGKPVEVTEEDLKGYGSGEKPKRSSFGARPKSKDDQTVRPSKLLQRTFETDEAPAQDGAPRITRSSDYKKKVPKTSFGTKKPAPGEYARTSDKKPKQKPKQPAHQYAGWLLSKREYSAAVLRRKLVLRGYSEQEADDALILLQGLNYQSDERYAEMKTRQIEPRVGDARVALTLRQKGIDEQLTKATIEQMEPEDERVVVVVEKFRKDIAQTGMTQELRQKVYRFLAYRGFSGHSINIAMEHLKSGPEYD